ncbi:MAG: Lrp/AsnC family transcriptional regulator [Muribaculaceae bacterium]|nr:Lrp/AsnC family transcriptional regulator [Muribaculaceae bacterium]
MEHNFDKLDLQIMSILTQNARESFQEIARMCGLSGAAIHQRIKRLQSTGVIKRWECVLEPKTLGYNTCAIVGMKMRESAKFNILLERIKHTPQVVTCDVTSGRYDVVIKLMGRSNAHILELVQKMADGIPVLTETLVSFQEVFTRQLSPSESEKKKK